LIHPVYIYHPKSGNHDYALNEETALVAPPKIRDALAKKLIRVLTDNS
jgi:hypothetical protein